MELGGIHHVTAVTGDAPGNVAFYTDTLGLRLVKKTVNQDDVSAYHLFYGDDVLRLVGDRPSRTGGGHDLLHRLPGAGSRST